MQTRGRHESPVKSMSIDNNSNNLLEEHGLAVVNLGIPVSISNCLSNDIVDFHCNQIKESDQENLLSVENSSLSDKVKDFFSRVLSVFSVCERWI